MKRDKQQWMIQIKHRLHTHGDWQDCTTLFYMQGKDDAYCARVMTFEEASFEISHHPRWDGTKVRIRPKTSEKDLMQTVLAESGHKCFHCRQLDQTAH